MSNQVNDLQDKPGRFSGGMSYKEPNNKRKPSEYSRGLLVDFPPVAYINDMNDYLFINYVADYSPIPNAIAPKSFQILNKGFPPDSRIVQILNLFHIVDDPLCFILPDFLQLFKAWFRIYNFHRPSSFSTSSVV